jgi:hypothetical protein
MIRRFTKKRVAAALGVVTALVVAGAAIACFSSTGSGTGQASVGHSTAFTINVSALTGGPLYPGSGTENIAYTVTNAGAGNENLTRTAATVASDTTVGVTLGDILHAGTVVPGCLAAWFTATNNSPVVPHDLAGGATTTDASSVDVTMSDLTTTNQDACQNKAPDITVTAS